MRNDRTELQADESRFQTRLAEYIERAKFTLSSNDMRSNAKRICGFSAAAGAALTMAPAAEAGIRYSGIVNHTVERDNPAVFDYPGPPKVIIRDQEAFPITNTAGDTVGQFALAVRAFNIYGYLGVAAFGSAPAIFNYCNGPCGATDPNFQALGRAPMGSPNKRPMPVNDGVSIGPSGAQFTSNIGGVPTPVSLSFFSQLPTPGNDDVVVRKWGYGLEAANAHYWEGGNGVLSAGRITGFKLKIGGQDHFGWIRLAIANEDWPVGTPNGRDDSPYKLVAVDWAYETTPNAPIIAGATMSAIVTTGDYNNDGVVNAADYTVWRDSLGATVSQGAGADGNANGMIDDGDYTFWKEHFGQSTGAGAISSANASAVPEPASAATLSLGLLALGAAGVRRHRTRKDSTMV